MSDGEYILGGIGSAVFSQYLWLQRVRSDGSNDPNFTAKATAFDTAGSPDLLVIAAQNDGKVLIAGTFDHVNDRAREGLARLLVNGATDPTFETVASFTYGVKTMLVQPDGRILVGGAHLRPDYSLSAKIIR